MTKPKTPFSRCLIAHGCQLPPAAEYRAKQPQNNKIKSKNSKNKSSFKNFDNKEKFLSFL